MDKKILIVFLFLCSFAKGQILTETFPHITPDTLTGQFFVTQDSLILDNWGYTTQSTNWKTDIVASKDFGSNGSIVKTSGSIIGRNGTYRDFPGSTSYMNRNDATLNPGTNDFSCEVFILTPNSVANPEFVAAQRSATLGWHISVNDDTLRAAIIDGTNIQAKVPISANSWYYAAATWDRDGNCILRLYSSSGLVADTVDISSMSASNLNPANQFMIGTYPPTVTVNEWNGGVLGVKWDQNEVLSDQQLTEDAFLAENWKSGGGNVYRTSFGFHQGILHTGGGVLTVGLKGGTQTAMSAITGDSTRYTHQIPSITSLSGDSLIIVAGSDSVWHPLSDSTFTAERGFQVVLDVWQLGRLTAPLGNYAFIDNITVSTYALTPEISVNPVSYAYGNINVGDSTSTTIQVINTGDGTLTVSGITAVTAAQINVSPTSFTVAASDSQAVTVYFKPQAAGALVDTLTIANDDADESSLEVPLSAIGVAVTTATTERKPEKLKSFQTLNKF
jgi:hypothetical protein